MIYLVGGFFGFFMFISQKDEIEVKEVTLNDFFKYVENKQIKSIDISKDKVSTSFFNVYAKLNNNTIIKLTILNSEQFMHTLNKLQLDLGIPENQLIPIKYSTNVEDGEGNVVLYYSSLFILSYCIFKLYSNIRGGNKMKNKSDMKPKDDDLLKGFKGMFNMSSANIKEVGKEVREKEIEATRVRFK